MKPKIIREAGDYEYVVGMVDKGYTWREVGVQLAYEHKRPVAYLAGSVQRAYDAERRRRDESSRHDQPDR